MLSGQDMKRSFMKVWLISEDWKRDLFVHLIICLIKGLYFEFGNQTETG